MNIKYYINLLVALFFILNACGQMKTAASIEKIKKESEITTEDVEKNETNPLGEFDLRNEKGIQEFKKKIKKIIGSDDSDSDEKSELAQAKEEMIKAKEELEKARIALEKATQSKSKKK